MKLQNLTTSVPTGASVPAAVQAVSYQQSDNAPFLAYFLTFPLWLMISLLSCALELHLPEEQSTPE